MTVIVSKPAVNLREELAKLKSRTSYVEQQFWYTGDAATTDFALQNGWKPLHVFNAGAIQKEGASDDYEVVYDGFTYTVSFAVAPANAADVCIIGVMA
jgi:hypothetical protein